MPLSKPRLSFALVLIAVGIWQLAVNVSPEARAIAYGRMNWPVNVIGSGLFLGLIALVTRCPGWYIPACIVTGVGGLLFYQNRSGDWDSWAYAWTLIPAFVAVGLALMGIAMRKRGLFVAAAWTLFGSIVLFGIFGSVLGGLPVAGAAMALAAIMLGVLFLVLPFRHRA
jgi:hypothetical protein